MAALTREAEENVRDGDLRYLVSHRSVPYDFLVVVPPLDCSRVLFRAQSRVVAGAALAVCILWRLAI